MTAYQHILLERADGVATITLNRPAVLNAMNNALCTELNDAMATLSDDVETGCVVVTGAGERAFSAGGDIHELREDDDRYDGAELDDRHSIWGRMSLAVATCAKPTIGMMNGLAYGGGALLASALDMRIGCEGARFRFLAAVYGRINSTWTLPHQVGWPMAKELMFTGRVVEAAEAHRIGLLNHLVTRAELRPRTMEIASTIAGNDRGAVGGIKKLLIDGLGRALERQWANERDYTADVLEGAAVKEAFSEFLARKGRAGSGAGGAG